MLWLLLLLSLPSASDDEDDDEGADGSVNMSIYNVDPPLTVVPGLHSSLQLC